MFPYDDRDRLQLCHERAAQLADDHRRARPRRRLARPVRSILKAPPAMLLRLRRYTLVRSVPIAVLVLAIALPSVAVADPSGPNVQDDVVVTCNNGKAFVGNGGTLTNQSHQAFAVDSTSIFVLSYLAFTVDGAKIVVFDSALRRTDLVTCMWTYGPYPVEARGFFTPAA